jgi:hypothetical protein
MQRQEATNSIYASEGSSEAGSIDQKAAVVVARRGNTTAAQYSIGGRRVLGDVLGGDVFAIGCGVARAMAGTMHWRSESLTTLSVMSCDDDKDRRSVTTTIACQGRRNSHRGLRRPAVETAAACRGRQGSGSVVRRCRCLSRGAR